jgi:hypothetical protein
MRKLSGRVAAKMSTAAMPSTMTMPMVLIMSFLRF